MKIVLCLAILTASAVWAEEAADRAAIESTISALNSAQPRPGIFTADFPNAAELQRVRAPRAALTPPPDRVPPEGTKIQTSAGTLVVSHEPMGEATFYPPPAFSASWIVTPRFRTRSITFVSANTAVVVAEYEAFMAPNVPAMFVLRKEGESWRIASFRSLPEAQAKPVL